MIQWSPVYPSWWLIFIIFPHLLSTILAYTHSYTSIYNVHINIYNSWYMVTFCPLDTWLKLSLNANVVLRAFQNLSQTSLWTHLCLLSFSVHMHTHILLLLFSRWVVSDSLWPCGLQHPSLLCPPLFPGVGSDSCPLSQWCYLTISSSAAHFFCLQSFPASLIFSNESALCVRWPKY